MPGVANSTIKCPNFGALVRAMALRPVSAIELSLLRRERSLAGEIAFGDRLLADERRARSFEGGKMGRLQMILEGLPAVIDFIEQDAIRIACRLENIEAAASRLPTAGCAGIGVDRQPEPGARLRLEVEIDEDDIEAHCSRPMASQ